MIYRSDSEGVHLILTENEAKRLLSALVDVEEILPVTLSSHASIIGKTSSALDYALGNSAKFREGEIE